MDLGSRLAVVTGGASGIGAAVARSLAVAGAHIAIADKNVEGAQLVADEITEDGHAATAFFVELTERASVDKLQAQIVASLGTATLIVNGAGWNVGQPFLDSSPEHIETVLQLNLLGPIWVCRAFLGPLVDSGVPGCVINIASDAGRVGSLGEAVYSAAKGGLIALTKSLAREMARHHITVNCVSPGPTNTPLFALQPPKIQEALIHAIPFRRLGEPEEIASAVAYLASEKASYITGQVLSVNGGLAMVD